MIVTAWIVCILVISVPSCTAFRVNLDWPFHSELSPGGYPRSYQTFPQQLLSFPVIGLDIERADSAENLREFEQAFLGMIHNADRLLNQEFHLLDRLLHKQSHPVCLYSCYNDIEKFCIKEGMDGTLDFNYLVACLKNYEHGISSECKKVTETIEDVERENFVEESRIRSFNLHPNMKTEETAGGVPNGDEIVAEYLLRTKTDVSSKGKVALKKGNDGFLDNRIIFISILAGITLFVTVAVFVFSTKTGQDYSEMGYAPLNA